MKGKNKLFYAFKLTKIVGKSLNVLSLKPIQVNITNKRELSRLCFFEIISPLLPIIEIVSKYITAPILEVGTEGDDARYCKLSPQCTGGVGVRILYDVPLLVYKILAATAYLIKFAINLVNIITIILTTLQG